MREKILNLLEEKGMLPPLPDTVLRIQKMVNSHDTGIKEIASVIEIDPALAGRILKLANSPFYSRSTSQISTLPVAITKIGLNTLVKIVYSLKMTSLFTDKSVLDNSQFWRHSLAVAIFTQSLSRKIKCSKEEQDIIYLAGLMHDIGIMVFTYLITDEYSDFLENGPDDEKALYEQEMNTFDIDHAEAGSLFIEKWWEMDERVSQAVRHHHSSSQDHDKNTLLEKLVQLANDICNDQGITNGTNFIPQAVREETWEELNISQNEAENIITEVQSALEQAEGMIGML